MTKFSCGIHEDSISRQDPGNSRGAPLITSATMTSLGMWGGATMSDGCLSLFSAEVVGSVPIPRVESTRGLRAVLGISAARWQTRSML